MSAKLKAMREERAKLGVEINRQADTITGDKKDFDATEKGNWDKVNADYDSLTRRMEIEERADGVAKSLAEKSNSIGREDGASTTGADEKALRNDPEQRALAMQAWFRTQNGKPLKFAHKRACKVTNRDPNAKEFEIRLGNSGVQKRALTVGTNTAGGATIPQGFVQSLEKAMLDFNGIRQAPVDVMRTTEGNPLPWPTTNDTGNKGVLLAENAAFATTVDPVFAQTTFNAYKFASGGILISSELLEDSAFNLEQIIGEMCGERIGRAQADFFTTGTGTSQPQGAVTGATTGKTTASATAITFDEIIDLYHSIDPAYRMNPSVGFMMHDTIVSVVRKLKDAQGKYLWEQSLQVGVPDKLLNRPLFVNQSMASAVVTTAKTMLFGDFAKYKIRDVNSIRLRRLDELYAGTDQVGFVCFMRSDARVLNAGVSPLKLLVQA